MQRTGRPTQDPKPETIKFRINETMRAYLTSRADERGVTVSQYLRELVSMDQYNNRARSNR